MLKIRLTRRGKRNNAFYRLVVAENTSPIKGRFIEVLGFLNPHSKEKNFKEDRIKYWIEKGAQCSDTVHNLLVTAGIVSGSKRAVKMNKKPAEAVEAKPEGEEKKEEGVAATVEVKAEVKSEEKQEEKQAEAPAPEVETKKQEKIVDAEKTPEKKEEKAAEAEKSAE
jgi:small subunit ribosomal protein S16